jgi:hypothetical protein
VHGAVLEANKQEVASTKNKLHINK